MTFLLDTCVVSELVSTHPNQAVVDWIDGVDPATAYLSVITIGEIRRGIESTSNSKRQAILTNWLEKDLLLRFRDQILPLDVAVLLTWGELTGNLDKLGKPLPAMDSLLAATARHYKLTLVTRNLQDFTRAKIDLFCPWSSSL